MAPDSGGRRLGPGRVPEGAGDAALRVFAGAHLRPGAVRRPSAPPAGSLILGVDYDASTGPGTVESRVRLLLDEELEPFSPESV